MAAVNKTRYAVLGLLTLRPMSGYDMKQMFEKSLSNFWSESYGQIYPTLRRLAAEGLVERSIEREQGQLERKVYTITEEGRAELQQWLAAPVESNPVRMELLLKFFFGNQLGGEGMAAHLQRYRKQQMENLRRYREISERLKRELGAHPDLGNWLITLSFGRHQGQAALRWCDETLRELGRREERQEQNAHSG